MLESAWKMESARLARAPGVFFQIGEIQLSLKVDKIQLSLELDRIQLSLEVDRTLEIGEIQLPLRVSAQLSFISAAPTQNSVTRMENASKLFNCELNKAKHFKNPKAYAPLYLRNLQSNFQD